MWLEPTNPSRKKAQSGPLVLIRVTQKCLSALQGLLFLFSKWFVKCYYSNSPHTLTFTIQFHCTEVARVPDNPTELICTQNLISKTHPSPVSHTDAQVSSLTDTAALEINDKTHM